MTVHVPPFVARPSRWGAEDTMTLAGARALARQIEEAWAACGHRVRCKVIPVGVADPRRKREAHFAIRSDLVRGLPAHLAGRVD